MTPEEIRADMGRLEIALKEADRAGNVESAKRIAQAYKNARAKFTIASDPGEYDPSSTEFQERYGPTRGTASNFMAGWGQRLASMGRGIRQLAGDVTEQEVADARALDAPLMSTTAGQVGSFVGGAATTAPLFAVPGINTVAGAALSGAALGAIEPTVSDEERGLNIAVGAAAGAAGQKLGNIAQRKLLERAQKKAAEITARNVNNRVMAGTLRAAQEQGYVVPPSTTRPTAGNQLLEGVAGKVSTQNQAAIRNQEVTNRLAREALGLPEGTELSPTTLAQVRETAGKAYEAIKNAATKSGMRISRIRTGEQYLESVRRLSAETDSILSSFPGSDDVATREISRLQQSLSVEEFTLDAAIEKIKRLRADAAANFRASDNPAMRVALGRAQKRAARILEAQVESSLKSAGADDLVTEFIKARKTIAQSHAIEAALNEGTGNVNAQRLAAQMGRGDPLSGNLNLIGRFANAFPKAAQEVRSSNTTALDIWAAWTLSVADMNPAYLALPAARRAARSTLLSGPYQNRFTAPYSPTPGVLSNRVLPGLAGYATPAASVRVGTDISEE